MESKLPKWVIAAELDLLVPVRHDSTPNTRLINIRIIVNLLINYQRYAIKHQQLTRMIAKELVGIQITTLPRL